MSNMYSDYSAWYANQILPPQSTNWDNFFTGLWEKIQEWWWFLWSTAKWLLNIIIFLLLVFSCYSCYYTCKYCRFPRLITFECCCPCLSLNTLKKRFQRLSTPGILQVTDKQYEQYPPTDVEKATIERIQAMLRKDIAEVGDGY